jgi:hypothetical protein
MLGSSQVKREEVLGAGQEAESNWSSHVSGLSLCPTHRCTKGCMLKERGREEKGEIEKGLKIALVVKEDLQSPAGMSVRVP